VKANGASRRPVRLKINRLPPEAVGRLKWAQRVWDEVSGSHSQADPPPEETWRRKLWCLRNGFVPMCWDLYSLGENDPRDYLSDREREMSWVLNWPYAGILDDKLGFEYMLRQLGAPTPATLALIINGRLTPMDDGTDLTGGDWLRDRLDRRGRLVLKPIWGGKGYGISVIQRSPGGCRINGEEKTLEELEQRLSGMDRYLVAEYAQQAAYAEAIFPGSANTMRILTMHDEDGVPFIAAAAHRFGAMRSRGPVDSWSAGGLSAGIDLETGELTAGVTSLEFARMERHDHHPDTGTPIKGNRVANWDTIRNGIVGVARKLPFLPYIGWDVVATDSGFLIIEGNKQSNVGFLQVHRPLLRDPRVRAFYEREGII
jgi:hypothetical protein